ncbi:type IV-A pilus assembly ATPase PilB [Vibrio azureus]|uniref:Type 4 pilus assembly protein PilB n=1 Tax=Vibrio azureus NBRC 104587 TaxID=1219077 RepID=U3CGZ9_9VIBR|nr:type IV-A pilus assembly ATPase PilB [Vibrio azureus]AUI86917.1 type IV-A pilus assembly ATPase PilB [Vibrio azureus]GAD77543.1 type 4 pilus assembly protein PilB [Vibrio azureus NBRC 104587]
MTLSSLATFLRQTEQLSASQEETLYEHMKASGVSTPEAVIGSGHLQSQELTKLLSQHFGLTCISLTQYDYIPLCQSLGLRKLITRHHALPVERNATSLTLAVADPTNLQVEDDFRFATGLPIELVLADFLELRTAIKRLYGQTCKQEKSQLKDIHQDELADLVEVSSEERESLEDLSQDNSPVSRYINQILLDAVHKGASDIHFEPYEEMYRIRLRCDGILVEIQQPPKHLSRRLSSRIKILSKLDIAERRLPQDGRIKLRLSHDRAIDMRVSTLPTLFGEKIVLRLLDSNSASLDINTLGYNQYQKQCYLEALKRPQGMILMTGPTGSGKTVSLYSGLRLLNQPEINIATAEDPVEIHLPGINQVQIQPKIGFGFSQALRSFLRQDPDVVMVGEIRDFETADIAIKAAQTGHLVLSTLHTNSAAETVIRLSNMGIERFNLASSLSLIVAQRLARKLCIHCRQPQEICTQLSQVGLSPIDQIFQANPNGCDQCTHGYCGRTGIYEVMRFDSQLSTALLKGACADELERLAIANGMQTLQQSGLEKLKQGITSLAELQRVLYF